MVCVDAKKNMSIHKKHVLSISKYFKIESFLLGKCFSEPKLCKTNKANVMPYLSRFVVFRDIKVSKGPLQSRCN